MMKIKSGRVLTIVMVLLVATGVQGANDSWNMDASLNWDAGGNWLGSAVPGSTTVDNADVATFSYTLTADCIITVDAPRYIGGISFGNMSAFKYTLSDGLLRLNNGGVIQTLDGNGDHTDTIASPIQFDGATAFFTANASSANSLLSIGAVTGSATAGTTNTLTLNGPNTGANAITGVIGDGSGGGMLAVFKDTMNGSWTLTGANTYTGGTTIKAGTFNVYGDQSAATGGWLVGPQSYTNITCNFKSGSSLVVPAGQTILIGSAAGGGLGYATLNVAGSVTNSGSLMVGRGGILNVNSGCAWTQNGDMDILANGGRNSVMTINGGSTFTYAGINTIKVNPAPGNTGDATLTINGTFITGQGFERTTTPITGGYANVTLASGSLLRLSAGITDVTVNAINNPFTTFSLGGRVTIDTDTNNATISHIISGSGPLIKSGTGTLTLSATNTYTGITTNKSGTIKLAGGNNRLRSTGTFAFASTSTLDIDNTSQTLATMTFPDSTTTATIKGDGGALILNGATTLECGPGGVTVSGSPLVTVNMMDLSNFTYDSAGTTFRVGLKYNVITNSSSLGQIATVTLASNNVIRANLLAVGDRVGNNDGGISTLHLGQISTLSVNVINCGDSGRSESFFDFATGLINPTVTIRSTDGSSAVSSWNVGRVAQFSTANQLVFTNRVDLSAGTLDAKVTTMNIGVAEAGSAVNRAGTATSSFSMGEGLLMVTTLTLGKIANTGGNGTTTGLVGGTYRGNGTFSLNGGTVSATTITLAENTITDGGIFTKSTSGTFLLSNGTLRASTVQKGPQTVTATATTTFRWVAGTIGNISGSDLVWTNIPLTLQTAASHVFDITGPNTATFDTNSVISGSGCAITKIGNGTLTLCSTNTYSGGTIISNGTLAAGCDNALFAGSALTLSGGAFDAGSYANTLGTLTLSNDTASRLLVNSGACTLFFTGMSGTGTLDVIGSLGSTAVQFGTSDSTLTGEQLSRITINGHKTFLSTQGYLRELVGTKVLFR